MVRRAIPVVAEGQGPHPRVSYWRGIGLEDAADNFAVGEHVEIVVIPFAGGTASRRAFEGEVILIRGRRSASPGGAQPPPSLGP
jgi:hypothetical protein